MTILVVVTVNPARSKTARACLLNSHTVNCQVIGTDVRGQRPHLVDELPPETPASIRRVNADLIEFDDKATVGQGGLGLLPKPGEHVAAHRTVSFDDERMERLGTKRLPESRLLPPALVA